MGLRTPLLSFGFLLQALISLFGTFFTAAAASSHQSNIPVEVQLKYGRIRGQESIFLHKRVRSYLSVPFGEPPIGDMRFKPPVAKRPWNHTIDASHLAPACFQGRDTYNESFWGSEMWNANTRVSEDCLYMNIWAPAEANNLTVMVWIFGGGFFAGSPSLILYDGKALALTANVVVVNINYRLGPFGYIYFDHPDAPGNIGMLDQQLAFYWIRENIARFGGNPASISLFGESAGASSIVAHLIAPGSRGIFHNGILQSGSLDNKWSLDSPKRALEKSHQLADLVQCNRTTVTATINCLKERTPEELLAQMWNLNLGFLEFPFAIVSRDRNFFREFDAFTALRKKQYRRDVNLMIGVNHDEANFVYLGDACQRPSGKSRLLADHVNQMVGDYFFTCDSIWLADQMDDGEGKVFIYYFDQPSSANPWPSWTGVMHGYEIEYVFGVPIYNTTAGYTSREKTLSHKMIQYWSSFAKDGVPRLTKHHRESPEWPQYKSTNRKWMHLKGGSHVRPIEGKKDKECRVWRGARDIEYNEYLLPTSSSTSFKTINLSISTTTIFALILSSFLSKF
uniref:Carboxylic ester hydrolase n=1 Tax=Panagrolaimus sp. PS1159 TaxID=55785 RepID=A0AC35FDY8_9BILA